MKAVRIAAKLSTLLVTVVAVAALVGVAALITGPRLLGWQGIVVLSGSMEPTLKTGGIAFVEPVSPETVRVGDILTSRRAAAGGTTMVTHRVIEVVQPSDGTGALAFRTQGDANDVPDSDLVPAGAVVGTVRFDVPYLGHVVDGLRQRTNYYLFIGIPAALLILSELWNIANDLRRSNQVRLNSTEPEGSQS